MSATPAGRAAADGAPADGRASDDAVSPHTARRLIAESAGAVDVVHAASRGAGRTPDPLPTPGAEPSSTGAGADADESITVDDVPALRVHHPSDLLGVVLSVVGLVLVMGVATFAPNTTTGVAEDVHGFSAVLQRILFVPAQVLAALVLLTDIILVFGNLAVRRLGRQVLEALAATAAAAALNELVLWAVNEFDGSELQRGLSVHRNGEWVTTLPLYIAIVSGMLTVVGPRGRRRIVAWGWNLLWIAAGVDLITARVSLPGLIVSLLIGRLVGLATRYLSGVQSERAYGRALVAGVRRAGFDPARLTRIADEATDEAAARRGTPAPELGESPAARALTRSTTHRVYELETTDGQELDVVVIDGDRQVVGMLSRAWRSLRMRGIEGRSVVSLRQATERAALLAYAARAAGVRTPKLLSVAEADDSMLLVQERPGAAVPLTDIPADRLTDRALLEIWRQLQLAHDAGIAHRALTSDVVLAERTDDGPIVWLTGWEQGDVASSELARRMDVTQLVALLALRVGAQRALESAVAVLPDDDIAAIGPLLQTVALPRETRDELRAHKEVLAELRTALVARLPQADVQPQQLVRFGARTVMSILLTTVAIFVVLTTINVDQIADALTTGDWRWIALAFALGLLTLFGAGLSVVALSPVRVTPWHATLMQTAATYVALAVPAGIGPAALHLRMLQRRGVSSSLAAATAALVQVLQFVVTVLLLLVLSLVSGQHESLPISPLVLLIIGVLVLCVAALLLVPKVRQWVAARVMPIIAQVWPRLIEVLGQPWRLLLAVTGNLLNTLGYVCAFAACMEALGQHASLVQVALIYLTGNTAGAIIPTPGGMGTVELALGGTLAAVTGINPGIAASIAVLFRVLTYWLRIPLGWVAMRFLQRRGEL